MLSKYVHETLGVVTLSQSRRATRISISIRPSGEVRLSYPVVVSTRRALAFLDSKAEWIVAAKAKIAQRTDSTKPHTPEEIEQLRAEAKRVLPARTAQLAKQFGFKYQRLTIRATRSKWGCCTGENNLSLSLFLMTLPDHLRDFVILHELCHTVHHNHSAEFHALLNACTGGREKELHKELRTYKAQ